MTRSIAFVSLFVFVWLAAPAGTWAGSAARQAKGPPRFDGDDLKVRGVGLKAPRAEVVRRLGAPRRADRVRVDGKGCGGPHTKLTLFYEGLKVTLHGSPAGRGFRVMSLEVTSAEWEVMPGVGVGADEAAVRERLGKPEVEFADSGGRALIYQPRSDAGGVSLTLRGGRVTNILMALPCNKPATGRPSKRTLNPQASARRFRPGGGRPPARSAGI